MTSTRNPLRGMNPRSPMSDAGFIRGMLEDRDLGTGGWALWRMGRWVVRNWRRCVVAAVVLAMWGLFGSLAWALMVSLVMLVVALTLWVSWKSRNGVAVSLALRDALEERRLRASLRNQWPLACERAGLTGPGQRGEPPLRKVKYRGDGSLSAEVRSGVIGVPVADIQKNAAKLASIVCCRDVVVTETAPGCATIEFHWRDLVGRTLPLAELPIGPVGDITYGRTMSGGPASFKMNLSLLVGGLTEYGKSNIIHASIADLIRQGVPVRLYISDPKGGMELREYGLHLGEQNGIFEVRDYAKTAAATEAMLERMAKAMLVRQSMFEQQGLREWTPSPENPLTIAVIDELLELTQTLKKGAESPLAQIVRLGRAVGYTAWVCTQVGQMDAVGRLRNFIPQRISLATRDTQTTDTFLGNGATAAGAACHLIRRKGEGYALSNSDRHATHFRAALVTDEELRAIAAGKLPATVEEMTGMQRDALEGRTALYRHYDVRNVLLYVGITNNYARRSLEHSDSKPWWSEVDHSKVVHYPTRKAAMEAEKRAILTEKPLDNDIYNGKNVRRRSAKRVVKKVQENQMERRREDRKRRESEKREAVKAEALKLREPQTIRYT